MFDKYTYSQHNTTRQNAATAAFSASTPRVDYQLVATFFHSFVALQLAKMERVKNLLRLLFAATLFFQSIFSLQAQNTSGTDFWLTFGSNLNNPSSNVDLQIRIVSGEKATSGTINFTNLGTSVPFNIGAYQVHTYPLTPEQREAAYISTTGVSNRSILVHSNEPVTVYAMNQRQSSTDATNVLPLEALDIDYYQISYVFAGTYAVIATKDGTEIFENGVSVCGTLNTGDVYYKYTTTDLTGAHITANKPITLFSLQNNVNIPYGYGSPEHLMQQLSPVNTWGKKFFVPVSHLTVDIVRIVVSQNNTTITQTGGVIRPEGQTNLNNLQAGQFVELEVPLSSSGCYITANKPVGVCTYLVGRMYHGLGISDPAQSWLPPIAQSVTVALITPFIPSGNTAIYEHYALLTTPTTAKENTMVSVGGAPPTILNSSGWRDHVSGMSYHTMQLTNPSASYSFTNEAGFLVYCYGVGTAESYYYLAYSNMKDLTAKFFANDIQHQELNNNPFCEGEVTFRAEIDGLHPTHEERIRWFVNGTEESGTLNQETWQRNFTAGNYNIRMWVRYENDDTISKTGTLFIKSCNQSAAFFANNVLYSELKDTTFCNKNVNFRAEIEGLHPTASDSIMWYINDVFETSQATWSKPFENGTYEIKLVVHYDNDTYATLTGTLKIQALWIKIRNVRY